MKEVEIRKYLAVIKRAVSLIENLLEETQEFQETVESPPLKLEPEPINEHRKAYIDEILSIENWPEAIPEHLIASETNEDQINRANCVLDSVISRSTEGIHFLDFGCGDGWIAKQILHRGVATSTGFDLIKSSYWEESEGVIFTNVFRNLIKNHYDVIMLYDVLDHCEDAVYVLNQVKSLLKPNGIVYVRCHPWTSKHGTHLCKNGLNKAYIHHYIKWEELLQLGYKSLYTRIEKDPLTSYKKWFKQVGFKIDREDIYSEPILDFFNQKHIQEYLSKEHLLDSENFTTFYESMKVNFVDFHLTS